MKPILIALTSPAGSTREVAGVLSEAFGRAGHPVELTDFSPRTSLENYAAVVVAAPIHGMRWMPEAVDWVAQHQTLLRTRPVALVALSYLYFEGRPSWKKSIIQGLEAVRAPLPHASVQVFPGRLPSALPAPVRWLFGVKKGRPLDLLDPLRVKSWAAEWVTSAARSG